MFKNLTGPPLSSPPLFLFLTVPGTALAPCRQLLLAPCRCRALLAKPPWSKTLSSAPPCSPAPFPCSPLFLLPLLVLALPPSPSSCPPPHRRRLRRPRDELTAQEGPPRRPLPPPPKHTCWEARNRANRARLPDVRPPLAALVLDEFRPPLLHSCFVTLNFHLLNQSPYS